MDFSNRSINGTPPLPEVRWTYLPIFIATIAPFESVLNALVFIVLILSQQSQHFFNIYLINLSLSNLAFSSFILPIEVVNTVNGKWPLGRPFCFCYQFVYLLLHGCVMNSHVLLTFNRLWAVFCPVHYHRAQARHFKFAVSLCIGMWTYVGVVVGGGFIVIDVITDSSCMVDTDHQIYWSRIAQVMLYDVPLVFLAVAIPVVWYKRRLRIQNRVQQVLNARQRSSSRTHQRAIQNAISEFGDVSHGRLSNAGQARMAKRAVAEKSFFKVWLVLTSVTVWCWAALVTCYAISVFGGGFNAKLLDAGTLLYSLTPLIDPILIIIIMPTMRIGSTFR